MNITRRQRRPKGLPLPPGTLATEVRSIVAQCAAAVALGALGIALIASLDMPQWMTTTTCLITGAGTGLSCWTAAMVVGRSRIEHARRWRDDPDYRQQWGQGL